MTVLILTSEDDVTADIVVHRLHELDTPVLRLDPAEVPGRVELTVGLTAGGELAGRLGTGDRSVDLASIRSVWVRRPGQPGQLADAQRDWVGLESERALYGALRALPCAWMNHPDALARSQYKVWQLRAAVDAGFKVPRTMVTTIPDVAEDWAVSTKAVVVKSVSGRHPEGLTLPTSRVPPGADFAGVSASPTCLQEEIDKGGDVRLTVVGDKLFACAITSQDRTLDWRFLPPEDCSWSMTAVPGPIQAAVRAYTAAAGLVYAAIDFAVDMAGHWWFLEANAGGQFGFIELATGAPISSAIAQWLTEPHHRHQSVTDPTQAVAHPGGRATAQRREHP